MFSFIANLVFFQCTVLSAIGEECVIATKINTAIASEKDILVCIMNTTNIAFGLITKDIHCILYKGYY